MAGYGSLPPRSCRAGAAQLPPFARTWTPTDSLVKCAEMERQLTFSWSDSQGDGRFWPSCHGDTPLSCLLTDDGGLSRESTTEWIAEGIAKIDAVIAGKILSDDWDREDWGSCFTLERTVIYSLYDETCSETLPTPAFFRCLQLWRSFLESEQTSDSIVTITVS